MGMWMEQEGECNTRRVGYCSKPIKGKFPDLIGGNTEQIVGDATESYLNGIVETLLTLVGRVTCVKSYLFQLEIIPKTVFRLIHII